VLASGHNFVFLSLHWWSFVLASVVGRRFSHGLLATVAGEGGVWRRKLFVLLLSFVFPEDGFTWERPTTSLVLSSFSFQPGCVCQGPCEIAVFLELRFVVSFSLGLVVDLGRVGVFHFEPDPSFGARAGTAREAKRWGIKVAVVFA